MHLQLLTAPMLEPEDRLMHTEILNKLPASLVGFCSTSNHLCEFLSIMADYYRRARAKVRELQRIAILNDSYLYVNNNGYFILYT